MANHPNRSSRNVVVGKHHKLRVYDYVGSGKVWWVQITRLSDMHVVSQFDRSYPSVDEALAAGSAQLAEWDDGRDRWLKSAAQGSPSAQP